MLDISDGVRGEWRILTATGRADVQALDKLDKAIADAVEGSHHVAVDLSGVEYMSSAGLRALMSGARAAQKRGATLVICSPVNAVRKVFDTSGVSSILTIQDGLPC